VHDNPFKLCAYQKKKKCRGSTATLPYLTTHKSPFRGDANHSYNICCQFEGRRRDLAVRFFINLMLEVYSDESCGYQLRYKRDRRCMHVYPWKAPEETAKLGWWSFIPPMRFTARAPD
jgi:hypothetical protein